MLKLTRLNRSIFAINPDHILWVEASPDTTLFLSGGEKVIVRETLDELIREFVELKRRIHGEPYVLGPDLDGRRHAPPPPRLPSAPPLSSLREPVRLGSRPPPGAARTLRVVTAPRDEEES